MPWKVSAVLDQRIRFVLDYQTGLHTMAELCRQYQISRQTGYETMKRYQGEGAQGLQERSRAPLRHPHQTPADIEARVVNLRRQRPSWGPRKLRAYLAQQDAATAWPAPSTIGALVQREGLAIPRRKRRRAPPYTQPLAHAEQPNQVWCADFKGWFTTADGDRIDPLTISDAHSRYLLRCQAVEHANTEQVRAIFEASFREYGMPLAIRTDNGTPFASRAIAGLSRLSLYWMKLGIVPERIQAGHPEQNGRHERMHLTLKQETASPPAANRRQQQLAFDCFRRQYNQERPHEALEQKTPASCYQFSPREYPARVPEPEYGDSMQVRRVQGHGQISWKHHDVFLSEVLIGEYVGFEPIDERYWCVYFADFAIALFDSHRLQIQSLPEDRQDES